MNYKGLLNRIFRPNEKYLVWNKQVTYKMLWKDKGYSETGRFNFMIHYYPNRNVKFRLSCTPKSFNFWPANIYYYHQHPYYPYALEKLRDMIFKEIKLREDNGKN